MARIPDSYTLLVVPLDPTFSFVLTDLIHFYLKLYRISRPASASLRRAMDRVVEKLPKSPGIARLSLKTSGSNLRLTLRVSRHRLSASRLKPLLRNLPSAVKTSLRAGPAGAILSLSVPILGKR